MSSNLTRSTKGEFDSGLSTGLENQDASERAGNRHLNSPLWDRFCKNLACDYRFIIIFVRKNGNKEMYKMWMCKGYR